uniref:CASP-like protein n=1 Tax=Zea mays TaxID=4577 RepID=B6U378_MAIZE|nr:hypothetical protein [Zea mays]
MALQAQASPSPSTSPTRERTGSGEWPDDVEKLPAGASASPPYSSDAVELVVVASTHHAAAARYSEAVNVIGFLYSVFQFVALVELMRRNKHLIPHRKRGLFDFTMDQVLAYLLISSSSSATARVSDLIDNWGSDPFPTMANGSIAISFMAFAAFGVCSLISAYNLFRRDM